MELSGPGLKNYANALSGKIAKSFPAGLKSIGFLVGGQRSGKCGRGAESKTAVALAVERDDVEKQLDRIRLHVITDCSADSSKAFIQDNIAPGSRIENR